MTTASKLQPLWTPLFDDLVTDLGVVTLTPLAPIQPIQITLTPLQPVAPIQSAMPAVTATTTILVAEALPIASFVALIPLPPIIFRPIAPAPVLTDPTASQVWTEGQAISLTLPSNTFTDPRNQALIYTATLANGQALPSWLTFNATTRSFTGTAPATAETLSIKVTATDTSGLSASETFGLSVIATASEPVLAHQTANQTWQQGQMVSFTLPSNTFTDPQNEALSYTATESNGQALPSWLSFNATTHTFTGTVPAGLETFSIKVTATDTSDLSTSETFGVTVPAAPPVVTDQTANQIWQQGQGVSFVLAGNTFTDPQGETLGYTATLANGQPLPSWLSFDAATETFSGTVPSTAETLAIKVTATDTSNLSSSETFNVTVPAAGTSSHLTINVIWDSSVSSAPSAFKTAVMNAVQYLESEFSNPITINLHVGYGEIAGGALSSGALGESDSSMTSVSYSQLLAGLSADATTSTVASAIATLPSSSPVSGGYWVTTAEAKALGLMSGSSSVIDGYVGFSSTAAFTYNDASGVAAGTYDFNGVVLHEITEVMGRQLLTGDRLGSTTHAYDALDLFHYSAAGTRDFSATTAGYFSINDGTTSLGAFNTNPSGDAGDWASSVADNSFDAFSSSGVVNVVTANDITEMNVLGWTPAGDPASTTALANVGASSQLASSASAADAATSVLTITDPDQTIALGAGDFNLQFLSGATNETVVLQAGSMDEIGGFSIASGDVLDLRALLASANVPASAVAADPSAYLSVADQSGNAVLAFDPTGHGGGSTIAILDSLGGSVTNVAQLMTGALKLS